MRTFYEILDVPRTASQQDVKRAFRQQALHCHPDRNPQGEKMFKELVTAYEILVDPSQRSAYDRTLARVGDRAELEAELQQEAEVLMRTIFERDKTLMERARAASAGQRSEWEAWIKEQAHRFSGETAEVAQRREDRERKEQEARAEEEARRKRLRDLAEEVEEHKSNLRRQQTMEREEAKIQAARVAEDTSAIWQQIQEEEQRFQQRMHELEAKWHSRYVSPESPVR
eukprot:TRINITY_DN28184_c0_g1_i1.p1 TRINITY_DN28184_c0_g1~~TRINITY_DN28184_c0_g1_i1.p1  ORF type:complete len:228 (+),score=65.28 TRINITY_DN28184_c0_g1_i1:78-761(+)